MKTTPRILLLAAAFTALALAARAQPNDSNVSFNAPGLLVKKPKPGAPDPKAQPLAWPRLDPGAVLCRSESDLTRLAERRAGEPVSGGVDCQIVRAATPITILQRKAPGRTEVKSSGPQAIESGWTDAWLPEKAPSQGGSGGRPR